MTTEKNILYRLYAIAGATFLFAFVIAFKLVNIQVAEGEKYKELSEKSNVSFNAESRLAFEPLDSHSMISLAILRNESTYS